MIAKIDRGSRQADWRAMQVEVSEAAEIDVEVSVKKARIVGRQNRIRHVRRAKVHQRSPDVMEREVEQAIAAMPDVCVGKHICRYIERLYANSRALHCRNLHARAETSPPK
jgi:hypothetical protein